MTEEATTDTAPASKPTRKERKRASAAAIDRLIEEARVENLPAVSEIGQTKLFIEWEKSAKVIQQAQQMLTDAIKRHSDAAVTIVKRLGPGPYRYRDKLYSASANGETVYLRELRAVEKK